MSSRSLSSFLESHVSRVEPLSREVNLAYWNATISGKKSDFDRYANLQLELQTVYSDRKSFEDIRAWRSSGVNDPFARRQVELLHNDYLRNQIDPKLNEEIVKLGTKIENEFNVYRATLNGKKVTSNDILKILKENNDSRLRMNAWEAGRKVGALVKNELIRLVRLRNEAAHALGYDNYYSMSLDLSEQNEKDVADLFNELDALTAGPFESMKEEVDGRLATKYGIHPSGIRPWHYEDPFFQECPQVFDVDLNRYYNSKDILEIVVRFFHGIGLRVDDILARSDLYEKSGKDQHAFCTDIDRKGDIRILANIKNDETWMATMLHELGHGVYDKHIDPELPFLLRQEAHIFTTEAIAMLFGRLSKDAGWTQDMLGISTEEKTEIADSLSKSLRCSQLVFSRWCQVMVNFERELYSNPDRDLNALWWGLVQKYQKLDAPEGRDFPDWATKTHIVSAPVYYHNYLLGELLASQIHYYISRHVLPADSGNNSIQDHTAVGAYLIKNVFSVGARYRWDETIERATAEKLTPKYFVEQFVR
jgi:peptidyl-dipeptidase A